MLGPFRSQAGVRLFAGIALLVWFFFPGPTARAQGCVASREGVCVTDSHVGSSVWGMGGSHGESWLSPRRWQVEIDYRYFHSHRHFIGDVEQTQRATQHTEVNNIVHIMNVAGTYEVNPRFSLTLSAPIYFNRRFNERTPDQVTHAYGLGDITLVGRTWLFHNPSESRQNIAVGFGIKLPTGAYGVTNTTNTAIGPVTRAVDQSIQPGDGGWGMVADFEAYKAVKRVTLYASGSYLSNPRNTNGVQTGRSRPSEAIMSVADQYAYRSGLVAPFPKLTTLVWSIGIRGEGVPSRDLIGDSDGFRRPGYILSVDPGFIYTKGKNRWTFNAPIPFRRVRTRSVPDIRDNAHGDAAFADYTFLVSYSRHF
jgi:Putative MetA-pathway of phenol degradation